MQHYTKEDLINFKPKKNTFVGIDSDGCVFPTMEIKQKQCFHKLIISCWGLEDIAKYVRESAEFVNLYSKYRGQNRFPCLLLSLNLLRDHPKAKAVGTPLPDLTSLQQFIDSGVPLSNTELEKAVAATNDPVLAQVLAWSLAVNEEIARTVKGIPPFKWVKESLDFVRQTSDMICVSQTPTEALVREWEENNLMEYVSIIAGQELGTKAEHLQMASGNRYPADKVLMIGDAPGDYAAAEAVKACFYPINPGAEEDSWERFYKEAYNKFLSGNFKGGYEDKLVADFHDLLPGTPPWAL